MSPVPHAQLHIPCEYAAFDSGSLSPLNCFVYLHVLVHVGLSGKPGGKTPRTRAAEHSQEVREAWRRDAVCWPV